MSNINATLINEEFPIAGVNNNTQGFRDNFSIIKENLSIASDEITEMQETLSDVESAISNLQELQIPDVSEVLTEVTGVNNITAISSKSFTTYPAGLRFQFRPVGANTSGAMTLNVNGRGAKSLRLSDGTAISPNSLSTNSWLTVEYNGSEFVVVGAVQSSENQNDTILSVFDFMTTAQVTDVSSNIGSIDVTQEIQNAINAVPSPAQNLGWGGTLLFPPGRYKITAPLLIDKHINIEAYGARVYSSGVRAIDIGNQNYLTNISIGYYRVRINGMYIEHAGANEVIRNRGIRRIVLERVQTINGQHGFYSEGAFDVSIIDNCRFQNTSSHGINLAQRNNLFTIKNSSVLGSAGYGIHMNTVDAELKGIKLWATDIEGCAGGIFIGGNTGNVMMDGCWFENNTVFNIRVDNTPSTFNKYGISIYNCQITGNGVDVLIGNSSSGTLIDGVSINSCEFVDSDLVVVGGNKVTNFVEFSNRKSGSSVFTIPSAEVTDLCGGVALRYGTAPTEPFGTSASGNQGDIRYGTGRLWFKNINGWLMVQGGAVDDYTNTMTTLPSGSTPSASNLRWVRTNNSSSTTITNLTGGYVGQELILWGGDSGNTTIANNANIRLASGANFTLTNDNAIHLLRTNTKWVEVNVTGGGGGGGSGTVTSVGFTMPGGFTVSNSPITSSGTINVTTTLNGIIAGTGTAFNTVNIGPGLNYDNATRTLSATGGGSYTLPVATSSVLGGIKVGTGLAATIDGTLSVPAVVSILDYGVVGDGIADDATAIQNAFNYIKTRGGKLIFPKPAVRYRIRSSIGSNPYLVGDLANNVELYFEPGTEILFDPLVAPIEGRAAITLEGNNVSITGQLTLTSNKTINWQSDPAPQRVTGGYYTGIVIGGKGYRFITKALGLEKSNVKIDGVICRNYNLPIVAYAASNVVIENCIVEDFTDTGILIDDCLRDVEIRYNTVRRGFDDCFFDRHYYNTPWALNGYYIGTRRVHHNSFYDTFAKSAGFGGSADVDFHNNYCANTWYAGVNVEIDSNTWFDNSKRIRIHDNIIRDAARNFNPTNLSLPAVQRAPVPDTTQQAGVLFTTSKASWPSGRFEHVEVYNNLIINPGWNAVSFSTAAYVSICNNKFQPGRTVKNGVNYDTGGQAVRCEASIEVDIKNNEIVELLSPALKFPYGYEIVDDVITRSVVVAYNIPEQVQNATFVALSTTIDDYVTYINAGEKQTVGNQCTFFGFDSGRDLTTGYNNVLYGSRAGRGINTGYQNTAVGNNSLRELTTGNDNTVIGHNAARDLNGGSTNTVVGSGALVVSGAAISSLQGCVAIGNAAGAGISGAWNGSVMIGQAATVTGENGIAVGSDAIAATNSIRLGNALITSANVQVAWTVTSDAKFKEKITDLDLGLDFAKSLRPVSYIRKGTTQEELGFVAQEVEEKLPRKLGMLQVDDAGIYGLRKDDLIAVLVKAVQELSQHNAVLEKRITKIESK